MTPDSVPVMTGKGTPRRTVRIEDETWDAAKVEAESRGETLSDVIRRALIDYVKESA